MDEIKVLSFLATSTMMLCLSKGQSMPTNMGSPAGPELTGCYLEPSAASCSSFTPSEVDILADLNDLCVTPAVSMPYMVVCSLWTECQAKQSTTGFCAPLSLVATGCVDMPRMSGCKRYNALCGNPATTVQQCKANPPVPKALSTKQARDAVSTMCGDHYMEGCDSCKGPSGYAQCPKPFNSLADICWGMSAMEGCTPFFAMCEGLETVFPNLCTSKAAGA
eukprot:jgi/Botrbrau1/6027/Bobra.0042s0013.1